MLRTLGLVSMVLCLAGQMRAADKPPRTLAVGSRDPKVNFKLLDGSGPPTWKAMRGHVVVLDFWATWCGPCVGAIAHLNGLKKELANDPVRFYSISYEPKAKVELFLTKHPMSTMVGLDQDLATFKSLIAWGIPMAYVFDGQGRVAAVVNPTKLNATVIRDILKGRSIRVEQHPGWEDPEGAEKYFRAQLLEDQKKFGNN